MVLQAMQTQTARALNTASFAEIQGGTHPTKVVFRWLDGFVRTFEKGQLGFNYAVGVALKISKNDNHV